MTGSIRHKGTVLLETERLILRRFTLQDALPMYHNWASDPDVTRYMSWEPHASVDTTKDLLRVWINSYDFPDYYEWVIIKKDDNVPIGSIGAGKSNDHIRMVQIGYCIGKAWWHQGYTSEALLRLIRFFFEEVGMNRVESCHDPENIHSGNVMKKCKMQYEGRMRQVLRKQNVLGDACYYAILAEDFLQA